MGAILPPPARPDFPAPFFAAREKSLIFRAGPTDVQSGAFPT
jgi:hypothetical protein